MRVPYSILLVSVSTLIIAVPASQAQQQTQQQPEKPLDQPSQPIPAIRSPLASAADNGDEDLTGNEQNLAPDTNALAGVQTLTVGGPAVVHSYWQPSINFTSTIDSNPPVLTTLPGGGGGTNWSTWSSIMGSITVRRVAGASDFSFNYVGGGAFSNDGSAGNGVVQQFGFVERLTFRRETLTLIDQLAYLPEAAFGFSAFGTGQLPGGVVGIQPGFGPTQSILTPEGQSLGNLVAAELDTPINPRSSVSLVGTYDLLHYFDNNLVNSTGFGFQAGYNRQLTRQNTLALSYLYSGFRYGNVNQSINSHTFQISFARRITGRMAFQVSGGPQIGVEQIPVTGTVGAPSGSTSGSVTQVYASLNAALQYQLRRSGLSFGYYHGLSGGSGVLGGAVSDNFSGSVSRQLSRTVSGSLSTGFSRNSGVVLGTASPTHQVYDYWFAGGNISHPVGREMSLALSYQLQYQTSSAAFCLGTACQTSYVRNLISFSLGWNRRPIPF